MRGSPCSASHRPGRTPAARAAATWSRTTASRCCSTAATACSSKLRDVLRLRSTSTPSLISHLHADHFLDLVPFGYALTYAPRQQPVPGGRAGRSATLGAADAPRAGGVRAEVFRQRRPAAGSTDGPDRGGRSDLQRVRRPGGTRSRSGPFCDRASAKCLHYTSHVRGRSCRRRTASGSPTAPTAARTTPTRAVRASTPTCC